MKKVLSNNGLKYEFLFRAKPHVYLSKNHPLAEREIINLSDLENYPRLSYDQGINNSFTTNKDKRN